MAELITAENSRDRMLSRFYHIHYNDLYHGRHAGEFDFLLDMLADDILDDDGVSICTRVVQSG